MLYNKLLKPYIFRKLEILSLKISKTDFSIDDLEADVVDLKMMLYSLSRNTHLITPERDKGWTCGISFRGLLDPKK